MANGDREALWRALAGKTITGIEFKERRSGFTWKSPGSVAFRLLSGETVLFTGEIVVEMDGKKIART